MNTRNERASCTADIANEAARYLEAVDLFASLGTDPHVGARARAAAARAREDRDAQQATTTARKTVLRWRS